MSADRRCDRVCQSYIISIGELRNNKHRMVADEKPGGPNRSVIQSCLDTGIIAR